LRQDPADPGAVAVLVVAEDQALASYAQLETSPHATSAPLRLTGLEPKQTYEVTLLNPRPAPPNRFTPDLLKGQAVRTTGDLIQALGLPLPVLRAGEIAVFQLTRV
ncbi:MAG TPA: GH36 C-terminal domain-containing protein, partial [Phenylobacterium sp.]|nr:GH36 C-terminal domain-containing protein [Phenylobacterium sp.]